MTRSVFPIWRLAVAALGLGYAFSEYTGAWKAWGMPGRVFSFGGFGVLQLGTALALLLAARRGDLPAGTRRSLRFFAASFGMLALGNAAYSVIAIPLPEEPKSSLADIFFLLAYPLQIAGFAALPRGPSSHWGRRAQLLDLGVIVLTAGILLVSHRGLRAGWHGVDDFVATLSPALAVAGLIAANVAIMRASFVPSARAVRTVTFSMALTLLVDVIYQTLYATGYVGPNLSIPVYVAVNIALLLGAWWYQTDRVSAPGSALPVPFSPLPMLVGLGGAAVLVFIAFRSGEAQVTSILVALLMMNAVLVAREFVVVVSTARIVRGETERADERRFGAMVRNSSDLTLVARASDLVIQFASPAARALLGRSPEDLVGTPLVALVHADDAREGLEDLRLIGQSSGATGSVTWRLQRASGEWRWFETSASHPPEAHDIGGLVLNSRDVTERKTLEEQLRQAQKMEVVGQLAGGIAHDFNNVLTTVLASSDLALSDLPGQHPLRQELEDIRSAAQRGAALTSRLLSFGRPRSVSQRIVDVGEQVESALPLVRRLLGERYIVDARVAADAGSAILDASELEHALLNLASNGRDAMPDGGTLTITVEARAGESAPSSEWLSAPAGRNVVVEVRDDGAGMDADVRARLFQPFFTTKDQGRGTGLGLAGVLAFMRRSNGGVTVSSNPGRGATFTLWFPRTIARREAPAEAVAAPVHAAAGTVLLLEDDDAIRGPATRILTGDGFSVLPAASADEARAIYAEHERQIEVLVADVMMPGESGASLAESLRRRNPALRVLFVSGYPGDELESIGLREAEVDLLRKPYTPQELCSRVRAALAT